MKHTRGMRPRHALPFLIIGVVVLAGVLPVLASPRPVPVCPPCAGGYYGAQYEVDSSVATVQVHEDGSATWVVRNELANESLADRYRADHEALVASAGGFPHWPDARLENARMEGDTAVYVYRLDEFATPTAGDVLRIDYFREQPGAYIYTQLGADRITVVGPEGTVATRAPRGAEIDGNRIRIDAWNVRGDGPYVTYAESAGPVGEAWSLAAVVGALWAVVARNLLLLVALPGAVLAGLLRGAVKLVRRMDLDPGGRPHLAGATAIVGAAVALHPLAAGDTWSLAMVAAAGSLLVAGAGLVVAPTSFRGVVGTALAGLLAGGAVLGGLALAGVDLAGSQSLVSEFLGAAAVLATFPLGYAAIRGNRRTRIAAWAAPVVMFALGMVLAYPMTQQPRTLFIIIPFVLIGLTALGTAAAFPMMALGASLATDEG